MCPDEEKIQKFSKVSQKSQSVTQLFRQKADNKMINSKRVTEIWLIPLRDILSFCIRIISYIGNSVKWRNNTFVVDHLGLMHEKKILSSDDPNAIEKIPDLLTP